MREAYSYRSFLVVDKAIGLTCNKNKIFVLKMYLVINYNFNNVSNIFTLSIYISRKKFEIFISFKISCYQIR